jgi:hypothetical protein
MWLRIGTLLIIQYTPKVRIRPEPRKGNQFETGADFELGSLSEA